MSKYSGMFGNEVALPDNVTEIEKWITFHPTVKTKAKRINYLLNDVSPKKISWNMIADIGFVQLQEATESAKCVDRVVSEFADMKHSLEPAENLIVEALEVIEGGSKGKGLGRLLASFKQAREPSEIREEVKEKIQDAVNQFDVKVPIRVDPFIEGLHDAMYYIDKIFMGLDDVINTLDYLVNSLTDDQLKDTVLQRKKIFAKSMQLMGINKGQLEQMLKICEQKKSFVEELKSSVIPLIESLMRASMISGNNDMSQLSEALKKIL